MPTYEFKTKDGTLLEEFFPISKAPAIGAWRKIRGRMARRVVSNCAPEVQGDIKPYVSPSLPKNYPGCHVDKRGFTIVNSRAHERAIAKNEGF